MKAFALTAAEMKEFQRTGEIPATARIVDAADLPPVPEGSPLELALSGRAVIADHKDPAGGTLDPTQVAEYLAHADVFYTDRDRTVVEVIRMAAMTAVLGDLLGPAPAFGANPAFDLRFGMAVRSSDGLMSGIWRTGFGQACIDFGAGRLPALVIDKHDAKYTADAFKDIAKTQLAPDAFTQEKVNEIIAMGAALVLSAAGAAPGQLKTTGPTPWAEALKLAGQQIYMTGYAIALTYIASGRIRA